MNIASRKEESERLKNLMERKGGTRSMWKKSWFGSSRRRMAGSFLELLSEDIILRILRISSAKSSDSVI